MDILFAAYVLMGAVRAYNAHKKVNQLRWVVDLVVNASATPRWLSLVVDATFLVLIVFTAIAWPVVLAYDEVQEMLRRKMPRT